MKNMGLKHCAYMLTCSGQLVSPTPGMAGAGMGGIKGQKVNDGKKEEGSLLVIGFAQKMQAFPLMVSKAVHQILFPQ